MQRTTTWRWVERGNDVHEVLSLITRFASVLAARALVVVQSDLFCRMACEVSVCLHRIAAMHSALVSAIVSSTESRSLNYEWIIANNYLLVCSAKNFLWTCEFFELDRDLRSAKSNFYNLRTHCAIIRSVKVNFWSVLYKTFIRLFYCREKRLFDNYFFVHYAQNTNKKNSWRSTNILSRFEIENTKIIKQRRGQQNQRGTEPLCIQNKLLSVHASSGGKDVARDKDGYSVQLAERARGDRGELFTPEPAPCRALRCSVPHLGVPAAWPRSPG